MDRLIEKIGEDFHILRGDGEKELDYILRLIYSLLRGEVKGEGKNGKFGECAGAYIRVGACPARRIEWILCGVGRF